MLVEELDVAIVDAFCNLLADLMRRPTLDHVQTSPSVLSLSARRGTDKEIILHLALKVVLFYMIGQGGRDLPVATLAPGCKRHDDQGHGLDGHHVHYSLR